MFNIEFIVTFVFIVFGLLDRAWAIGHGNQIIIHGSIIEISTFVLQVIIEISFIINSHYVILLTNY